MILESLDSQLDSEIPESILLIPVTKQGLVDRVIHNIWRNAKYPKETYKLRFPIQESPVDSLIPAVIPRAINVIRNRCGSLGVTKTVAL